jgi:hypothetical protein
MSYKYNMHAYNIRNEIEEDFEKGGWKCEKVIECNENSGE